MDSGNSRFFKIPDPLWRETKFQYCYLKDFKEFIERMAVKGCMRARLVGSWVPKEKSLFPSLKLLSQSFPAMLLLYQEVGIFL